MSDFNWRRTWSYEKSKCCNNCKYCNENNRCVAPDVPMDEEVDIFHVCEQYKE